MSNSNPPPGTSDVFPEEIPLWHRLEDSAREVFPLYGYGEMRTPEFEYTEVFERGLGNETEVVQKEMYTFKDRGGRSLTLRPEGTAGIVRALSGTDVMNGIEKRVYYLGPMFRGERPAAGRRRQFHQVGVENAGRIAPEIDAECIAMLLHYLEKIGITGSTLLLNTRGTLEDRPPAENALREYFGKDIETMCDDCKDRLNRNVWRILDCKQEQCQKVIEAAPDVVSLFSPETQKFFAEVCEILNRLGIKYEIAPRLVRGLDYYVHTVFEVTHPGLGAQNALAGGGRYELYLPGSKKPVIGVGFAAGLERLLMAQEALELAPPENLIPPVFLVGLGGNARRLNMKLAGDIRRAGIPAMAEVEDKSMKAQLRAANRINANFVLIRGDEEIDKGIVVAKDMNAGTQEELPESEVIKWMLPKIIKKC